MPPEQALNANAQRSQRSGQASPEEARAKYAHDQQAANDSALRNVQARGGDDIVQKKTGGTASASEGNAAAGPMNSDFSPHKKGPVSGDVSPAAAAEFGQEVAAHATDPVQKKKRGVVQAKSVGGGEKEKEKASKGLRGQKEKLPYQGEIQKSFGRHKLDGVEVYKDKGAKDAAKEIGARAYAMGNKIAFGESPDLHTAAHEAAHVVQQRAGVKGGAKWEKHADEVADAVVAGKSAEPLLDEVTGGGNSDKHFGAGDAVQKKATQVAADHLSSGYFKAEGSKATLGSAMEGAATQEDTADLAAMPDIKEEMGPATEEAVVEEQVETPADPGAPADGIEGADPGEPDLPETQDLDAPAQPAAPNLPTGEDADIEAMKRDFGGSINQMPTSIDGFEPDPGPAPDVELSGRSAPERPERQDLDAKAKSDTALAEAAAAVDNGPGPEQVQPLAIAETHRVEIPDVPVLDGMDDIAKAVEFDGMSKVTAEIKNKTDEVGQAQLESTVAQATTDLEKAQSDRNSERDAEIARAESENERLINEANAEQDAEITKARGDIDNQRADTKRKQQSEVDAIKSKSDREKAKVKADIDSEVSKSEKSVDDKFAETKRQAEREQQTAEQQAEREKRAAEREAENDSWWSRAVSAITSAFDALADAITGLLDGLMEAVNALVDAAKDFANSVIDACLSFVVAALEAYGELLKGLVDGLLGDIFPGLAAALTEFIDAAVDLAVQAVNFIAEKLKEGINALLDAVAGALNAIIAAYKAAIQAALALAKAVLTGDWEALGRMILEGVLQLAGIPPADFYALIDNAMGAIDTIIEDPGAFVGNVIDAAAGGMSQFGDNILEHLQTGFFEWIVGPLGEMGVTLPSSWDLPGIFGLAAQVLGLTQDGIRGVIEEELGETAGVVFDYIWRYVGALIEGGIEGLWEEIQNDLSSLYDMVIDGIKNWLIETIVTQAVLRLATMFNPVGALLNAIMTVWNVYTFLRDEIQRIWGIVTTVVNTIASIAAGDTQPSKDGIEQALAGLIPVAISFLANLLGISGITERVREIIEGIQDTVHGAIRSLIQRVKGMFSGGDEEEQADAASYADLSFSAPTGEGGATEDHRIYAEDQGGAPVVMIASNPAPVAQQTSDSGEFEGLTDDQTAQVIALCNEAVGLYASAKANGDPAQDAAADAKMQAAKDILASVAAANLESRATEEGGEAVEKLNEVRGDANCSGLLAEWEQGSLARFTGGAGRVIDAMRDEVGASGNKYILQGPAVPAAQIRAENGLSRVVDLPSVFNYYLADAAKAKFDNDADFFALAVSAGIFDPMSQLQGRVRGRLAEGWWFARNQAPSHDLAELIEQLAVGDDSPQYNAGVIRLDFSVDDAMANLAPKKPTAFDGMPFSQFQVDNSSVWGVTAGGTLEAVAPDVDINSATTKTLVPGSGALAQVAEKLKEKYEPQIDMIHEKVQDAVTAVFSSNAQEIFEAAPSWADIEAKLRADDTIKEMSDYPARSHAYGTWVTNDLAPTQLETAIGEVDNITLASLGIPAQEWINRRKSAISGGQGAKWGAAKTALQGLIWNKSRDGEAAAALKEAFLGSLTQTSGVHSEYRPENMTEPERVGNDGDTRFSYDGFRGARFTVTKAADGMLKSVTGTGLTLKGTQEDDVEGRGRTDRTGNRRSIDPQARDEGDRLNQNSSHMIADQFRGSGYEVGCNLVTASAHYNQQVMKEVEDEIARIARDAKEMEMTVSVEWIEYLDEDVVEMLVEEVADEIGADLDDQETADALEDQIEQELRAKLARMDSQNTKRVANVTYDVTFQMNNGETQTLNQATNQADIWL